MKRPNRSIQPGEDVVKPLDLLLTAHRNDERGVRGPVAEREEHQLRMVHGDEAEAPDAHFGGEQPGEQGRKLENHGFCPTIKTADTDG